MVVVAALGCYSFKEAEISSDEVEKDSTLHLRLQCAAAPVAAGSTMISLKDPQV